jgi:hypothetical protein
MSEVEKQESQKTVVAFITGLLIGGLLVWVFSSSPEDTKQAEVGDETAQTEGAEKKDGTVEEVKLGEVTTKAQPVVTGEGSITVVDQKAGSSVVLGALTYPATSGWVVVRDYKDNVPGNVLGAARYDTVAGLIPTSVELMRNTVSGNSYQIVYYTNSGVLDFTLGEDVVVNGPSATFKAQ